MLRKRRSLLGLSIATALTVGMTACSAPATAPSAAGSGSDDAAPVSNGAAQVAITLSNDGGDTCTLDHASAAAGPVTFTVTNASSTAITEVELQSDLKIIGEKENLAPGLPSSSFTVTLSGGTYTVYCPGGQPETQQFTVTGEAAAAPTGSAAQVLTAGTTEYAAWVVTQAEDLQTAVSTLRKAVDAGDLDAAKTAYVRARPFYEKIESDVEGFVLSGYAVDDNSGNLDYLIDMRASSLDDKVGWSGFHAVERSLYKDQRITDETKGYAAGLETNVGRLVTLVKALTYKPEDLANGAASLLEEVQANKITGEEEEFSHIDLVDFASNLEGAKQAFACLQPGLEKIDPELTAEVAAQFASVDKALAPYEDSTAAGGYIPWTAANRATHAKGLSQTVLALQQPLQRIAEKVATAN
ncbi:iron uptake system protein EfeO [Propionicicella superfundia]|uniref:iron uptake system protein EfeO n=1 Tax=Propionicicella superfundia TaxID=348582 RepID=UPI0004139627|nr:iron uptake system protein EfeO [Propionicicella superfundia]